MRRTSADDDSSRREESTDQSQEIDEETEFNDTMNTATCFSMVQHQQETIHDDTRNRQEGSFAASGMLWQQLPQRYSEYKQEDHQSSSAGSFLPAGFHEHNPLRQGDLYHQQLQQRTSAASLTPSFILDQQRETQFLRMLQGQYAHGRTRDERIMDPANLHPKNSEREQLSGAASWPSSQVSLEARSQQEQGTVFHPAREDHRLYGSKPSASKNKPDLGELAAAAASLRPDIPLSAGSSDSQDVQGLDEGAGTRSTLRREDDAAPDEDRKAAGRVHPISLSVRSEVARHEEEEYDKEVNAPVPHGPTDMETFPHKLHRMITYAEKIGRSDVVSFYPNGRVFEVHKPHEFAKELMPIYFSTNRIASFHRQLSLYRFKRVSEGPGQSGYFHEFFVRDDRDLCKQIKRRSQRKKSSKPPP